jgi:hypothetical protein
MKKLTNTTKVLRYVQKHFHAKPKEIAKATGVPINTVYQTIYNNKRDKALTMSSSPAVLLQYPTKSSPKKEVKDSVNSPAHYLVGGIETIDFIEAKALNYNLGNVVKYLTRADHKGNKLEDLKKARWYLCREINNLSK